MAQNHHQDESESEVAQSCPTLCNPMDCSPPGSSVYGIFQARVLEWVAISFSRGSSQPRDWTWVSYIAGRCFNIWATRENHQDEEMRILDDVQTKNLIILNIQIFKFILSCIFMQRNSQYISF